MIYKDAMYVFLFRSEHFQSISFMHGLSKYSLKFRVEVGGGVAW